MTDKWVNLRTHARLVALSPLPVLTVPCRCRWHLGLRLGSLRWLSSSPPCLRFQQTSRTPCQQTTQAPPERASQANEKHSMLIHICINIYIKKKIRCLRSLVRSFVRPSFFLYACDTSLLLLLKACRLSSPPAQPPVTPVNSPLSSLPGYFFGLSSLNWPLPM